MFISLEQSLARRLPWVAMVVTEMRAQGPRGRRRTRGGSEPTFTCGGQCSQGCCENVSVVGSGNVDFFEMLLAVARRDGQEEVCESTSRQDYQAEGTAWKGHNGTE